MMMTVEELRIIALKVVSDNQADFEATEDNTFHVSQLAYTNGVLDLLNAIIEEKGESL